MSDVVISVENLSKSYLIGHQGPKERYHSLRDTLSLHAKNLARRTVDTFRGRQMLQGDSVEEFWALKDVSFEVKQGEVLGIIGRNGAGKSTLLKILSRITEPTRGRVTIDGRVASLLEVGTGFHPELTGRENIFLNGAILGMSKIEIRSKFDEIVAFAAVESFLDTPVKRFSSGMYVRLAFAVAAHLEPEILIVDEVLAVGDTEFQKKCLGKMQDVAAGGRTVLFVSHNMGAIQQLCSRAVLMRSGTVSLDGKCNEVTAHYLGDASLVKDGIVDLRTSAARSTESTPIISRVVMRDDEFRPTTTFFSGRKIIIDIEFETKVEIKHPRIALAIEDPYGSRLFTLASYFTDIPLEEISSNSKIRCECGSLPLAPGRYLLSVSIGTRNAGLLDSIDNALWFEVMWDDFHGNGERHDSAYGPILINSEWMEVS